MYRGKIIAVVDANTVTKETLGLLMAGVISAEKIKKVKRTIAREITT
jgi:translation initiation factor RLI1